MKHFFFKQYRCIFIFALMLLSVVADAAQVAPDDGRMYFLSFMTSPSVAYVLLLLGMYAVFFEILNPGLILPGVIGALAICIALYILHALPMNYSGLVLIFFGIMFMIAESFTPTFGALGLGGAVAFVWGSMLLVDPGHDQNQISWALIAAMTLFNMMVFLVGLNLVLRSRRRPKQHGASILMGASGKTLSSVDPRGQAFVHGEIWSVYSKHPIRAEAQIKVIDVKGICLEVEEVLNEGE